MNANITNRIEQMLDDLDWRPTDASKPPSGTLPYATHSAVMDLFGHKLRCYRLNDGRAIIHADDLQQFVESGLGACTPGVAAW